MKKRTKYGKNVLVGSSLTITLSRKNNMWCNSKPSLPSVYHGNLQRLHNRDSYSLTIDGEGSCRTRLGAVRQ